MMTEEERWNLISYRLERAEETLQEAEFLTQRQFWNACANRLYYAAFYAVTALLLKNGHNTQTHKGVKTVFAQHFVKTGKISSKANSFYNKLFDRRQKGDYTDLINWTEDDILPLIEPTKDFIEVIKGLINS
jgi:uncharacterized protein